MNKLEQVLKEKKLGEISDLNKLLSLSKEIDKLPESFFVQNGFVRKRIAILSGYTHRFITSVARLKLLERKILAEFYETDYGLYEQAILSQDKNLKSFAPDICYFFVGTEHLSSKSSQTEIMRWNELWNKTHQFLKCDIIQNTFEEPSNRVFSNFDFKNKNSRYNFITKLNLGLAEDAPPYVHFNDVNFLSSYYGKKVWRDDKLYDISKVPVSQDFIIPYASNLVSSIGALFGKAPKCLVVDLDNTLWGGVIGDDGMSGIKIGNDSGPGEAYLRFQNHIKALKDSGIILAVCSKNDLKNAQEPFLRHREMALKLEDFSAFVANWEPKHQNIITIAKQLNIGLDSIVFVDDNAGECELVSRALPEVKVIKLPDDPADYVKAIYENADFDTVALTAEDANRTQQYTANKEREQLLHSAENYDQYLKNLDMAAVLLPFEAQYLPRITQLINKTNQFNLTNRRYTESEVEQVMSNRSKYITRYVSLKDKFGDNGIISAFIGELETKSNELKIDTWLMSCRVLKRNVEFYLFQEILKECAHRNVLKIRGAHIPTDKNLLVQNLFKDLGFNLFQKHSNNTTEWVFDMSDSDNVKNFLSKNFFIRSSS